MKLRIRKLLAAALALCLVVAMVPGAALAVDDPNPFKVGTESFGTLQDAINRATTGSIKTIDLDSAANLTGTATIPSGITLDIGSGASLAINDGAMLSVSVGGVLTNNGSIVVTGTFTSNGDFTHNGSIEIEPGVAPSNGGELTINKEYSGSGSITVGARATASLPNNQSVNNLTVYGTVSSSALTVTGNATVENGGKLDVDNVTVRGRITNNGEIEATSITVYAGSTLTHESGSLSGTVDVYGNLEVSGTYNQTSTITVESGGTMSVSGNYSVGANLTVDGTLNITGGEFNATSNFSVGDGAEVNVSGGAELNVNDVPDNGTISVDGSTLNVGSTEMIGPNSLSGDAEVATVSSKTVITVNRGTVSGSRNASSNNAYTVGSNERLVVGGSLTVAYPMSVTSGGELVVNDSLTINANNSLTVNSGASLGGSGRIDANGPLYVLNDSSAGNLNIYIGQNGGVYANNSDIDINVKGGIATTNPAPNDQNYNYAKVYSQGNTYNIASNVGNNGEADLPDSAVEQTTVNFTATPAEGYEVDPSGTYYVTSSVSDGPVAVDGNRLSFVMPSSDVTVYVAFREAENSSSVTQGNITVTTNHNGNGNVNASINGRTITVTATAYTNYYVRSIRFGSETRTSTGNPTTFQQSYTVSGTGDATVSVYVTFEAGERTVTVNNNSSRNGSVYLNTSGYVTSGTYAEDERVYLRVVPVNSDYELRELVIRTADGATVQYYPYSAYDDVYYFDMPDSNVTVYGYFSDGLYDITTDIDGRGSLAIRNTDGTDIDVAEEDQEVRIYPSANSGYRLGDIYVTYTDADDEDQVIYPQASYNTNGTLRYYWFDMPAYDVEVYATFGQGDYVAWIDREDMEHGSIRVSPNVADEDDLITVYVTPDTGYQLDDLTVEDEDGRDVSLTTIASGTRYTFRMPDSDVTITATFRTRIYSSSFTDVPSNAWYYSAVSYVASEGLMTGTGTNTFSPDGLTSRAQIVTILWRLSGEPSALSGAFTDVPTGQYYSTAVAWASREGIVTGVGNNRFEPNSNITREQLAVMLYRYAQDCGYSTSASANITGYYDYARVGSYARTALSWAVGAGLITGTTTTTLSPQDTATRAQVATILMRFCENIVE